MILLGLIAPQEIVILLVIVTLLSVLPIIALVDVLKNEFKDNNKLIWILVILFTWYLGAILYFFIGRKQKVGRSE